MSSPTPSTAEVVSGRVRAGRGERIVEVPVELPRRRVEPSRMIPAVHAVASALADEATAAARAEGHEVSCGPGCGTCCRQLVPISGAEAHHLARVIDAMPEPRRSAVRRRFDDARAALDRAGLLDEIERFVELDADDRRRLARATYRAEVACPFLVDESCSIHADRPVACRQYLVVTDPARCAPDHPDGVRRARPAVNLQGLLLRRDGVLALVDALRWAVDHPEAPAEARAALARLLGAEQA